jgi:hypothetical protein
MNKSLGHIEVVGYLGAWLQAGSEFPDRLSHMNYKPSLTQVTSFLDTSGLSAVSLAD